MLHQEGYLVKAFENKFIDNVETCLDDLLKKTDVIISPIPFSKDDKTLFLPELKRLEVDFLLEKMNKFNIKFLSGGLISKNIKNKAKNLNIKVFDFFDNESVAVLNAIPILFIKILYLRRIYL